MAVQFYDEDGFCAFRDDPSDGFVAMNFIRPAEAAEWEHMGVPRLAGNAWQVDDSMVDARGRIWLRTWLGVPDDFGELVEVQGAAY
jgi:hypothetical protein